MDWTLDSEQLTAYAVEYGFAVVGALLVFVVGRLIAKMLKRVLASLLLRSKVDATLSGFLCNTSYALLMALVVITAIGQLGVETTSLAAILAAAGLAIGLAFQSSLSNLASGVMIILFRPFKVGDYIEAAGVSGSVLEVNIFTTTLTSPDNKRIIVPNASITSGDITNYSAEATRRIDLVVGVSYGDDLKKVKTVLKEIVESEPRILKTPETTIAVSELADSSVNLVVRPWVKTPDYWPTRFDLTEAIKLRFDAEGISIPFPQTEISFLDSNVVEMAAPKKKKAA